MEYTAELNGLDWPLYRPAAGCSHGTERETTMKSGIHPDYHDASITCGSCGHVYQTKSTGGDKLTTEICGNCHPFYTGKQKLLDSAGRVDKFLSKYGMKK